MMFLLLTLALLTNALDLTLLGGARSQLAGTFTADGQVVFAGGVGSILSTLFNAVDVVTTSTDQVAAGQALSSARFGLSAATAANFSIFTGGLTAASSFSAAVDVYDATSGAWNTTTLAVARAHHCVGSTANYLYVAGGQTAASAYTDTVEVFDVATGEFVADVNASLSLARAYVATATLDSNVFFAGGLYLNGSLEVSAVVDVYDEINANWTVVELSEARQQLAAAAVGVEVLFAGGASATGVASATVDIWNSVNGTFRVVQLSVARWALKAVVVGDLVVFHGGYTASNTASAAVDIYNSATGAWTQDVLARARADFAAVAVGEKVYIAGGVSGALSALISVGSLEVLDFAPQSTPTPGETPTPTPGGSSQLDTQVVVLADARAQLAATVSASGKVLIGGGLGASLINKISTIDIAAPAAALDLSAVLNVARYALRAETSANISIFAGGLIAGLVPSKVVDIYNAGTNVWTTATLTVARAFHASATVGTKIYFAGGQDTLLSFTASVEVYDTVTANWTTLDQGLSQARGYLTAAVVGTKIVFAGGRHGTPGLTAVLSAVVDVYDTQSGNWTVHTLDVARAELTASAVGSLVLIGGGVEAGVTASVVVDVYDAEADEIVNTTALSVGRWALQSVTVGAEVLFVGGFDGTDALATVDTWDSLTGEWTEVRYLAEARYNFAVAVDVNGAAYFCGGQNLATLGFLASVEIYGGAAVVETPTPTPEGTPTPQGTPTPTPNVVPTPTPTPVPTPGTPGQCVQGCVIFFDNANTPAFTNSIPWRTRCGAWTDYFTCLAACSDVGTALTDAQDECAQTADVQDFCDCGAGLDFKPDRVVLFMAAVNAEIVARFEELAGVVRTTAGGNTQFSTDTSSNTFSLSFVWEDTDTDENGNTVTDLSIGVAWASDLAVYFNTEPINFVIAKTSKRAQQTASFSGAAVDNTGSSGVSQITVSGAFFLVAFLLHVLF